MNKIYVPNNVPTLHTGPITGIVSTLFLSYAQYRETEKGAQI